MVRAVLDANIFVSAAIRPAGPPGLIIERLVRAQAFELVMSPAIADEVERALSYPQVRKYIRGPIEPALWLEDLVILSDMVQDRAIARVCSDADDDKYIAAALEGRAGFVVSGDRALLAVGTHEGVRVVTPAAFLDVLS